MNMLIKSSFTHNFFRGFSQVLNIFPVKYINIELDDNEALKSDFQAIGEDFSQAVNNYELKEKKATTAS